MTVLVFLRTTPNTVPHWTIQPTRPPVSGGPPDDAVNDAPESVIVVAAVAVDVPEKPATAWPSARHTKSTPLLVLATVSHLPLRALLRRLRRPARGSACRATR